MKRWNCLLNFTHVSGVSPRMMLARWSASAPEVSPRIVRWMWRIWSTLVCEKLEFGCSKTGDYCWQVGWELRRDDHREAEGSSLTHQASVEELSIATPEIAGNLVAARTRDGR